MTATRVRASGFGGLLDCGYRWEGEQLLGMRRPASFRMLLGSGLHKSTAAYDQAKIDGAPITASDAADVLVDALWHPDEEAQRRPGEESMTLLEPIGLILNKRYCHTFQYRHYQAVELAIEPLQVTATNGYVIELTGTLDRSRIRKAGMGIGISDVKSGKAAVKTDGTAKTKGHSIQLGVYELLAEHALGIPVTEPAEIIGLRTSAKPDIGTGTIDNPRRGLIGTETEPGLIDLAAHMLESGNFYPNPQSMFCLPDSCVRWDTCPYHD